jgi:hypothetical protein
VRLEHVHRSPHYADGAFRNEVDTPTPAQGQSTLSVLVG